MGLPITSAGGNFVVGAIVGAAATAVTSVAEDKGVDTLGQIGLALPIGIAGSAITRGQFLPYMGGVLAAYGGYQLLKGGD